MVQFILPSLVVFLTAFYLVRKFLESESQRRVIALKKSKDDVVMPVKLQAYERLVIFMERISPENSVLRLHRNGQFASAFRVELIKSIQEEYEHNLSQQVYVSNAVWALVKNGKEEMINLITRAANEIHPSAPASDLATKLFEYASKLDPVPTKAAIEGLKKEARLHM